MLGRFFFFLAFFFSFFAKFKDTSEFAPASRITCKILSKYVFQRRDLLVTRPRETIAVIAYSLEI